MQKRQLESDDSDEEVLKFPKQIDEFSADAQAGNLAHVPRCHVTPECSRLVFNSAYEYEVHYEKTHRFECSVCRRGLPTSHYLHLHILEVHDSFFKVLAEKQNMYECYIETCRRKFANPHTRKRHLIDKHQFPAEYNFGVILGTNQREPLVIPVRRTKSLTDVDSKPHKSDLEKAQVRRHGTIKSRKEMEVEKGKMNDLADSLMKVSVPRQISFGKSHHHPQKSWSLKHVQKEHHKKWKPRNEEPKPADVQMDMDSPDQTNDMDVE